MIVWAFANFIRDIGERPADPDGWTGRRAYWSLIEKHTLEQTGGLYYAELERDDPLRETALTSSFLQASLFTSVLAFGVAAMAVGMGVLFVLLGLGIRDVAKNRIDRI